MSSPATYPVKLPQRPKKDLLPQSVFAIPSELDVSLMLEFVGSVMLICDYTYISDVIRFLDHQRGARGHLVARMESLSHPPSTFYK